MRRNSTGQPPGLPIHPRTQTRQLTNCGSQEAPRLSTRPLLRRITAVLSVIAAGVLAWAAAVPAASAAVIPVPGPGAGYGPAPAAAGGTVQVITAGGMPGWQITLIALAAALAAATAAIFLDRARASRRTTSPAR